jgi:hypothetical protein
MLTEYEVRRRVEFIRASRLAPFRKARMLLTIGKSLSAQVKSLRRAKEQIARTADRKAEAGLNRMTSNAQQLREDVREAAFEALHPDRIQNPYLS